MQWPMLAGLAPEDAQRVLQVSRRRVFGRQEVVFHRGDPADTLHLVSKGRFAVRITTPLGDTAVLTLLGPGESFGELALLDDDASRSATVVALESGETRSVHKLDFERLRASHPEVTGLLVVALAARVRRLSELLVEALYVPADARVVRRLHELAATTGNGAAPAPVQLTQEELAGLAGTSRATVNRVLREAERRGELKLRRGQIVVLDPAALGRRAGRSAGLPFGA